VDYDSREGQVMMLRDQGFRFEKPKKDQILSTLERHEPAAAVTPREPFMVAGRSVVTRRATIARALHRITAISCAATESGYAVGRVGPEQH